MSDEPRLFETGGSLIRFLPGKVSKRTEADRQGQLRRLGSMHAKHGHGPEGVTCKECAHLIRKAAHGGMSQRSAERAGQVLHGKTFLKCELYNVNGYEGSDWRAFWPACGQLQREGS